MKKRKYYKGLLIYLGILAFIGLIVLGILWGFLKNYQTSTATSVMNEMLLDIEESKDGTDFIKYTSGQLNEFETESQVKEFYLNLKKGEKLSYTAITDETTEEVKAYSLKVADDNTFKVILEVEKDGGRFGFDKWKIKQIDLIPETLNIIAPTGAELYINDIKVSDKYKTSSECPIPLLKNIYDKQLVSDLPYFTEYKVEGFISTPKVAIKENDQETILTKNSEGVYEYPFSGTTEFAESNSSWIIDISEIYGRYVTKDAVFSELSNYLAKGSKLYENMRTLDNVWYQEHESYEFKNQKVTNYKIYSENCFSCDVYFEQTVFSGNETSFYETDFKWIFVKIDGNWCLADMNINTKE